MSTNLINAIKLAKNSNQQSNEIKVCNAIASSKETPLKLGELSIDCYVLDDKNGTPVLSMRGAAKVLGLGDSDGHRLERFINKFKNVVDFPPAVIDEINNPIRFNIPKQNNFGSTAYGIKANTLIKICIAISNVKSAREDISPIIAVADAIIKASAETGITALIYEATGYERIKARDAYIRFFNTVLLDEAKKWEKFFDDGGILHDIAVMKKVDWARPGRYPLYFRRLINDLVYSRIAPNMMLELQNRNPKINNHRRYRHHQFFQNDGDRIAKEHLDKLHLLAMASGYNWELFMAMVNNALPVQPQTDIDEEGNIIEDFEE